ncbi:Autophagy-related, C-terminal [Cynara cardunculus var. scolymus]|uniref:Autophagy-related protein 2 n=1 Tax=Cynara cardunculus var. scolymus TaxID=59895 RepID=A0A103Y3P4_CYNCS|nr:Autophagy-related, C-terminal [Cynara cardunculus var. scolymus]
MFSWNFAKSAEAVFSRLAVKKICKFLLKKKLGQLILGDIDLNQLDVQLSNGTIQLSDLALNVDFINQKFGEAAILVLKEGSIGSLTVKLPWKGRNCEVEVEELEIVLAPGGKRSSQVGNEASTSGQDGNSYSSHDLVTPKCEVVDSTTTASVDIHEGVKTIAKMVKWLLTSFHVKIKKLIVALDLPLEDPEEKGHCKTLVLRFGEVECGTGISGDVNLDCQGTVDDFLGLSRLTNFVKFDGAVLEFLRLDGNCNESAFPCVPGETLGEQFSGCSSSATTPVLTGEKGGFSGTIKLSIPWNNGSLDIRKLDADVYVDPLELRLQPSSLKSLMYFVHVFEELDKDHKSFMHSKATESVYYNASSHGYSSTSGSFEFSSDKLSQKPETFVESYSSIGKDTALDALLRGSHLISDWMTSPISSNQDKKTEESDFGASVDQFFECFDELRSSQSALGNSGMWNWTCSVFSAITAASNLASGSLHIPSEQKHVETSLKARITQIVVLFSFVDEDQKPSCAARGCKIDNTSLIHYINADFHEMQLVLQVCPRDSNFEATVEHIEVADHFSNASDAALHRQKENVNVQGLFIRNKQAAVEGACPLSGLLGQGAVWDNTTSNVSSNMHSSSHSRYQRGIYRDDVVKVLLLRTSGVTRCQYVAPSVSPDIKSGLKSFSVKLPPLVFWVNFNLITTVLNLVKGIENSLPISGRRDLSASVDGNSRSLSQGDIGKGSCPQFMTSPKETLRGNISLLDARIVLCFPCQKSEGCKGYFSWNEFIVVDLSSPLALREGKVQNSHPSSVPVPRERFRVTPSHSLHLSMGNIAVYFVSSASRDGTNNCRMQKLKFCAERVLSVSDKAGHPSVISMLWQENAVTGPWITKRAKVLATSDGTTSRNKSTGKGHGLAFISVSVAAIEDIKGPTQNELPGSWCNLKLKVGKFELLIVSNTGGILGANFLWLAHGEGDLRGSTSGVPDREFILISCDNSTRGRGNGEGSNILSSRFPGSDIIHMWDPDSSVSQVSINIRCATIVAVGGRLDWFETITSFFSRASSDQVGDSFPEKEDVRNDTSRGSSFVLNLIDIGLSYEPYSSNMVAQVDSCLESSFVYDDGKKSEQCVAGLLAASNLKLSNVSVATSVEMDYEIKAHDVGLLLCEVSGLKNLGGSYNEQNLQKSGYVKVAEGTHIEAVLRTNCKNGHAWEVECSESHIVLDACQDSASGLVRFAAQIQRIFAPDVEESIVHLQTRWDNVQLAQESCKSRSSNNHSTSSSSQVHGLSSDTKGESYTINLMDEISEGAFNLDGGSDGHLEAHAFSTDDHECGSHKRSVKVPVPVYGLEDNGTWPSHASLPEFIEGYFLSDLRPLSEPSLNNQLQKESLSGKSTTLKESDAQVGSGWYGDSLLRIVEDHVLDIGEITNSKQLIESEASVTQTANVGCRKVKGRVLLKNIDVRWTLYAGSDWQYTKGNGQHVSTGASDKDACLEFALSKMGLQCDIYPDGEICISKLSLSVEDFSLNDVSKGAPWRKVLGCYQSKDCPRESRSRALKVDLESVRPHPSTPLEEYRLQVALLPMRLHLHQRQLEFLISFFGGKSSSTDNHLQDTGELDTPQRNAIDLGSHSITEEALLPYFQASISLYVSTKLKFSISPFVVRIDYIPSRVDLAALGHGKYVELVNLFQWKGVELQLKHVQAVGVYGWGNVGETIVGEWLEDISQNQIHKLLKGLPPVRSLVAVGSSAAKLVSLPVKSYKKDRRIVKGMQRGTIAFLRSVSLEAIGLGAHLAAGAHAILLQAEDIISTSPPTSVPRPIQSRGNPNVRSGQPKDARQGIQQAFETMTDGLGKSASALVQTPLKKYQRGAGVGSALATAVQAAPGAAIAPASAAARAMHSALLGVRNSLDPEHKKDSMDKYLGTTQSRPL